MEFKEYLLSKKIDEDAFKKGENATFLIWEKEFSEMNPESFTMQKKFSINKLRRKYRLAE